MTSPVRVCIIGAGSMALGHIRRMLKQQDTTKIVAICEPSPMAYSLVVNVFKEAGLEAPPNQPDLRLLLQELGKNLNAAFIITPHAYHYAQTRACLEAGGDVLLEKPMVITAAEAEGLIKTRDRTGR